MVNVYGLWILFSAAAALLAWQLHATLVYLAAAWLTSDLPKPLGWTPAVLPGIEKLSILVWGSLWLFTILYWERAFPRWAQQQRLGAQITRLLAGMFLLLVAAYGAVFFIGR